MLRAITFDIGPLTSKFLGVIVMGAAVVILFFLPWLDRSPVKSIRYRGPIFKIMLTLLVFVGEAVRDSLDPRRTY